MIFSIFPCSYGLLSNGGVFKNLYRNIGPSNAQSYFTARGITWFGKVYSGTGSNPLPAGQYRIRFSALKHFGNISNPNDFEVYRTPVFQLVY